MIDLLCCLLNLAWSNCLEWQLIANIEQQTYELGTFAESASTSISSTALTSKIKPGLHHSSQRDQWVSDSVCQSVHRSYNGTFRSIVFLSFEPLKLEVEVRLGVKVDKNIWKGTSWTGTKWTVVLEYDSKSWKRKKEIESKSKVVDQNEKKSTNISHNSLQWLSAVSAWQGRQVIGWTWVH